MSIELTTINMSTVFFSLTAYHHTLPQIYSILDAVITAALKKRSYLFRYESVLEKDYTGIEAVYRAD